MKKGLRRKASTPIPIDDSSSSSSNVRQKAEDEKLVSNPRPLKKLRAGSPFKPVPMLAEHGTHLRAAQDMAFEAFARRLQHYEDLDSIQHVSAKHHKFWFRPPTVLKILERTLRVVRRWREI